MSRWSEAVRVTKSHAFTEIERKLFMSRFQHLSTDGETDRSQSCDRNPPRNHFPSDLWGTPSGDSRPVRSRQKRYRRHKRAPLVLSAVLDRRHNVCNADNSRHRRVAFRLLGEEWPKLCQTSDLLKWQLVLFWKLKS